MLLLFIHISCINEIVCCLILNFFNIFYLDSLMLIFIWIIFFVMRANYTVWIINWIKIQTSRTTILIYNSVPFSVIQTWISSICHCKRMSIFLPIRFPIPLHFLESGTFRLKVSYVKITHNFILAAGAALCSLSCFLLIWQSTFYVTDVIPLSSVRRTAPNAPGRRFRKLILEKCIPVSVLRTIDAMSESNSPKTDTSSSSLLRQFRFQKKQTKAMNLCKNSHIFLLLSCQSMHAHNWYPW